MAGLADVAATVGSRVSTNVSTSLSSLSAQQWIRLIVIAGAYMLLRPYLIKLGGRVQMKQHEAEAKAADEAYEAQVAGEKAALTANDLRGPGAGKKAKAAAAGGKSSALLAQAGIPDPDDSSDDDDEAGGVGAASGANWGRNARRRQRRMLRKLLEAHEERLADAEGDEEDKDIQEFLVD